MRPPEHTPPPTEPPRWLWQRARQVVVAVIGLTVLAVGLALLVLPGPGILIIVAGLSILAIEYAWARNLLKKARARVATLTRRREPR